MSFPTGHPLVGEVMLAEEICPGARHGSVILFPHPVVAPIGLPAGQSALTELQKQPVVVIHEPAAADVADRQVYLVTGPAADIAEWLAKRSRNIFHIHSEHQGRGVRQRCVERWVAGKGLCRPRLLGIGALGQVNRNGDERNGDAGEAFHAGASLSEPCGSLSRNGSSAPTKACGWSMLTTWPAAGMTIFSAPGIFAAM